MNRIPYKTLQGEFKRILLSLGFDDRKAEDCARIFADNSRDGVYSHGLNRFPKFVQYIREGLIDSEAEPELESRSGLIERWNGNRAPGMLNAVFCMDRAIELAKQNGIGCVAIRNTNHWMRGGTYGWQAADAGCIGICFTNAIAMMAPWGGTDLRLGNNPLVIAVPRTKGHVVLDMAASQYSGGQIQKHMLEDRQLSFYGGYDQDGNLTKDPASILSTLRLLPIGFWKGSGLALALDLLVTILSKGWSTEDITKLGKDTGVSQVFICIYPDAANEYEHLVNRVLEYIKTSRTDGVNTVISYPGENTLKTRLKNLRDGIPVDDPVWEQVKKM